ncbi:MAG TPA: dienelactone hydrolase family protein [Candidatus Binataceae bacterium]|nr:dienelactone hydrolase family protein [Candidatus Binataceae bacterium]
MKPILMLKRGKIGRWVLLAFLYAAPIVMRVGIVRAQGFPVGQPLQIDGLEVEVWLPDPATPGPWPILVFSHRYRGCNTQSSFLMQALAGSGYAVFAPNHLDSECGDLESWIPRGELPFGKPQTWTDATYADRARDIENLLNALQHSPRYRSPPFDWNHLGLIGHSLGGYTVLGLAGAWPHLKDPRIKAVLALSPYAEPFAVEHTLRDVDVPVMYQGGTRDTVITPSLGRRQGAYPQTQPPKYLVIIDGAGHMAWVDSRGSGKHPLIVDYSLAFFDRYLKNRPFPQNLEEPGFGVADLLFQE